MYIMNHTDFMEVPKILESPYIKDPENSKKKLRAVQTGDSNDPKWEIRSEDEGESGGR